MFLLWKCVSFMLPSGCCVVFFQFSWNEQILTLFILCIGDSFSSCMCIFFIAYSTLSCQSVWRKYDENCHSSKWIKKNWMFSSHETRSFGGIFFFFTVDNIRWRIFFSHSAQTYLKCSCCAFLRFYSARFFHKIIQMNKEKKIQNIKENSVRFGHLVLPSSDIIAMYSLWVFFFWCDVNYNGSSVVDWKR